jgi:transposase InsO family protein
MALWQRGFQRGVLFHSDRGSQYCSDDYQSMLKQYGLLCSMSRKGNCWDNSVAESFFHTIKTELIHNQRYDYNRVRRHSTIGSVSPILFENQYKMTG